MFLLGYYAIVTAGALIGGKILSACLPDADSASKKENENDKPSYHHFDADYEPFELRSSEWCVLI